jgi:hypothetical protein
MLFPVNEIWKQAGVAVLIMWQNRLQAEIGQNRQRSLHIDKGNPTRFLLLWQIIETNLNGVKTYMT